jgi:hypothetical protein
MAVLDRILGKYVNIPRPLPIPVATTINGLLRLPQATMTFSALLGARAELLVPLISTAQQLEQLVKTVHNHPALLPADVVDLLVKINCTLQPNADKGMRDVVVGFKNGNNFTAFSDPKFAKLMAAINAVPPPHSVGLTSFIRNNTFEEFRSRIRNVGERFLADALHVIGRFHGTAHDPQLTPAQLPDWAVVHHYWPPGGMVSASITFNNALLESHVRKHVLYEKVNHARTPDPDEPVRWIDFLGYRHLVTLPWMMNHLPFLSLGDQATLFGFGNVLLDTYDAKAEFRDQLDASPPMRDDLLRKLKSDYEKVAIRTLRHGRKFVHYTEGNVIFITGTLNGLYVMARFGASAPDAFSISTAYLPSAADLLTQLTQWQAKTVWTLV